MKGGVAIKIIVHYPEAESKQKMLDDRISRFHAEYIMEFTEKLNCPTEQKIHLIDTVSKKISDQPL